MKEDFFKKFVQKATQENEQKLNAEKRKNHFKDLGRRGGLKKKSDPQLTRIISFRMTEIEYQIELKKAEKVKLKLSTFARMVYQGKVLKVDEFKTDEILLEYGNNFKRIKNLLRHREWNLFSNKKKIIVEIEEIIELIRQYLYSRNNQKLADE